MPFTKTGPNTYRSPSGRRFTKKQVRLYYATGGFKKGLLHKVREHVRKKRRRG